MCVGSIPASDPDYLRGWAHVFKQPYKVGVLRHNDCDLLFRREKYLPIRSVPQSDITQSEGGNAECLEDPRRERWRELGIDPNGHAAITG